MAATKSLAQRKVVTRIRAMELINERHAQCLDGQSVDQDQVDMLLDTLKQLLDLNQQADYELYCEYRAKVAVISSTKAGVRCDQSMHDASNDAVDKVFKPDGQRTQDLEATSFEPDSGPEVSERNENIAQPPVKVSLLL